MLTITGTNDDLGIFGEPALVGTKQSETIFGIAGRDALSSFAGNDILDELRAGAGDDIYRIESICNRVSELFGNSSFKDAGDSERGDVNFILTDAKLTGLGIDTLTSTEAGSLSGLNNGDIIDVSGFSGTTTLTELGGVDTLIGGKNKDIFDGEPSNDIRTGGAGTEQFLYSTITKFSSSAVEIDTIKDFAQDSIVWYLD
jgi:Ca2+-binding RTX toxin-like protein